MKINKIILTILILSIVTLVFSGCGGSGGITTPETPSDSLNAIITATPTSGEAPLEVTLDASESSAAQGNEIVSYEWNFGDSKAGEGQIVQHGFDSPGNYTVILTISDNRGTITTSSVIITVFQPTETVIEQSFDLQNGTEFDTGTGLRVSVSPSLSAEEVKLIVKCYPDPPQINGSIGNLFSAYSINMIYEKELQKEKLRPLRGSFEHIKLTFNIPEEEDIRCALIVNKTDDGWVIAENKEGPCGGTISEDGKEISILIEHFSDYGLYTYSQQDMQELLSELEAQNAVIESAPPVIPNYKGIIIIPKEIFPEGEGNAIPIHIPSYEYSSNANMEEEGWKNKGNPIIITGIKADWLLVFFFIFEEKKTPGPPIYENYNISITIQENKNTGGNLRAIIQLGDPGSVHWQRKFAGEQYAITNIEFGLENYKKVEDIYKKIGLSEKYDYVVIAESDKQHKKDEYIYYLSVNENNNLVFIPKIYSGDRFMIVHLEKFLKRILDIELPILNSYFTYTHSEDDETVILKGLSSIQIKLESTQSNLIPIANAGPDQTVQVGTLVSLDGTSSYDNDGDTLSYKWTQINGPEIVNLSDSNISKPTFTPTKVGVYEFELIVNDGEVNSEPDYVIINITGSFTLPPPIPLSPGGSAPGPVISNLTPTFSWQGVSGADYYRFSISIYPYETPNIIYTSSNLSTTSFNLPSGKLINGSKYRWNMRAFTNAGVISEYSSDLYFQTAPPPSSQVERITNSSFSSGTSGWTLVGDFWAGTNFDYWLSKYGYAAGGVNSAGSPKNNATGRMYQNVTIPSGATSATLSFWYNITSDETSSTAYDFFYVTIQNSAGNDLATVAALSNLNKSSLGNYNKKTFDMTPYKGQTIRVHFHASTDGSDYTVFRIDDVSLMSNG